ncbi:MAG: lysophospholipid acyltransferase family protein [Cyanobacteriota bacterium]|nr:lysophospholipid acyltransferase family protein [Cyanobacteriota bacterium]
MNQNNRQPQERGRSLDARSPQVIESWMPIWEWFYRYYFRVRTDGWHHLNSQEQVLIVGSHNGGMAAPDMAMVMYDWFRRFGTERLVYGLMHSHVWQVYPAMGQLATRLGAVIAHPTMAIAALKRGASVLVYPGGIQDVFRPYSQRHQIQLAGRKGFIKLALRENVPIVPIVSTGAHDTLFVLGDIYPLMRQFHEWGMPWLFDLDPEVFPIYLGLPWGVGFGPIPNWPFPSQIRTRVCAPIRFDRSGRKAASDRAYVAACYAQVRVQMQAALDELVAQG